MMNFNQLAQAGNILSSIGSFQGTLTARRDIVTVNGLQEAKDFKLDKGERIAMIDSGADILYIKECDDIGKYSLKVFECKDITDRYERENTPAVISRAEFDSLMGMVQGLLNSVNGGGGNGKHNAEKPERKPDAAN